MPSKKPASSARKKAVKSAAKKTVAQKAVKSGAKKKPAAKKAIKPVVKKPAAKKGVKPGAKKPASPIAGKGNPFPFPAGEKYMSERQLRHFRHLLEEMRAEILSNNKRLVDAIKSDVQALPDENDRASKESEFTVELRERERERRLLDKVDAALQRVSNKNFGYCKECGDEIGLHRLCARPVATLCIECKNLQETMEKSGVSVG